MTSRGRFIARRGTWQRPVGKGKAKRKRGQARSGKRKRGQARSGKSKRGQARSMAARTAARLRFAQAPMIAPVQPAFFGRRVRWMLQKNVSLAPLRSFLYGAIPLRSHCACAASLLRSARAMVAAEKCEPGPFTPTILNRGVSKLLTHSVRRLRCIGSCSSRCEQTSAAHRASMPPTM
jgi:hypothetical protein